MSCKKTNYETKKEVNSLWIGTAINEKQGKVLSDNVIEALNEDGGDVKTIEDALLYLNEKAGTGGGGAPGKDGFSPTVSINKVDKQTTVTITDKSGEHTATINDGIDGQPGTNGQDGVSPTVEITKTGKVTTVTITDKTGTHTATINDGEDGTNGTDGQPGAKGDKGEDGVSPTISAVRVSNGVQLTITDKNGSHTAVINDGIGDGSSVATFADVPSDGKSYLRQNGIWVEGATKAELAEIGAKVGELDELETTDKTNLVKAINEVKNTAFPDAPQDGEQYVRQNGAWVKNAPAVDSYSKSESDAKYAQKNDVNALSEKVDKLTQVGAEKTYTFSEAFTEAGIVLPNGTFDRTHYLTAFHTDYIDISKYESVIGMGLWNNTKVTWPASFYDENKVFLYGLAGTSVDASKASNPNAKYVVFQGESGKTNAKYAIVVEDGAIPAISKQMEGKADKDNVPTTEEFDKVKDNVEEIVGYEDRDITDSVTWVNGRYDKSDDPLTSVPRGYNSSIAWASGKCAEIDVTNYDEIAYKNAISEASYVSVGYLIGDGKLLLTIDGDKSTGAHVNNEGNIDLTEYKGYSNLTLKINGSQVQERFPSMKDVIITVTKNGISKDAKKVAKKIVLNGDSLCNQLGVQLMRICHAFGYDLLNRTRGGEKIIGNLTRAGGIACRIAQQFTMPASGSVNIKMTTTWVRRSGEYAGEPISWTPTNGEIFWVKNIKGILKKIVMPQVVVYNSSKAVIKTYTEGGNNVLPAGSSFIRININTVETTATPHVTVGSTPLDIDSVCVLNGYVETNGSINSDSRYKTSDFIPVTASQNIYVDGCATTDEYTFEREETGESVTIGEGTYCFYNRLISDKDLVHIWFSGQNGGYEDADDYAEMTNSAARSFGENFIVMTTHTANCKPAIIRAATAKFGNKYLNIRDYLNGNAINNAVRFGLLDASYIGRDWEEVMLDAQKVHQSDKCAYLEAVQVWNRLVDLQLVEGERVDSGDYFIAGEPNLPKWYNVPEMGYGVNWPFSE